MDRQIVYAGQVLPETTLLNMAKDGMVGLGTAMQAVLGTTTLVDGLACTPTGVPSLQVNVSAGSIYSLQNMDSSAFSSLAADTTHQIVKQGIVLDTSVLSCPAPATTGQSINYLVQATYQDVDSGSTVLPYYNSSNPTVAYNGPANSGVSQNTSRKGVCVVAVKTGVAATTGTQVTPSPDSGYVGLWVVTVANGQTQITSPNIVAYGSAPFISEKLTTKISQATGDARYLQMSNARIKLSANTTFYVSTTGSDSNTGLAVGSPWQTIQKAINTLAANYDLSGYTATIQLADGTYSQNPSVTSPWTGGGSGSVIINGNASTPSNVVISLSSSYGLNALYTGCGFTVQNLKLTNSVGNCLTANIGATIIGGVGLVFGAAATGAQISAQYNGQIIMLYGYTINGSASSHLNAFAGGAISLANSTTVTVSGTPAFSAQFALATTGDIQAFGITFSGAATGTRYLANANGVINTSGGGATYLPGSVAGSVVNGLYL